MKITDLLLEDTIRLDLKSNTKKEVIIELAQLLEDAGRLTDYDTFLKAVFEREKKFSTGIGMGVAIPHAKSSGVKQPTLVFGKSKDGIDFDSSDNKVSYLFFLIAVPEKSSDEHLKILSKLSRSLMHEDLRQKLRAAASASEVLNILD